MQASAPSFQSKLPQVGTTIFTVMSALAQQYKAVNLSQGFPDFEVPPNLIEAVYRAMKKGFNQYAPMPGLLLLREKIAEKTRLLYGADCSPDTEITVTSGATEAIFDALSAVVCPGDEVIVLEPAYDCYLPAIELNGGKAVTLPLEGSYTIPWDKLKDALNPKTKLLMINSPHNPTGAVLKAEDLKKLEALLENTNTLLLSDEVYEHIIFDGQEHESVLKYPKLRERSFVVSSFGKTYHATGWKLGYCIAPPHLSKELRKIHQYVTFSSSTPMQYAVAEMLDNREHYLGLPAFYQAKRDYFAELLKTAPLKLLPCSGSYFQLVSYEGLSQESEADFAVRLTKEAGVAAIPLSPFYADKTDRKVLRLCFAKEKATLDEAAERLCRYFV